MLRHTFILSVLCLVLISCGSPPIIKGVAATKTRVESTVSGVTSGTVRAEQVAELAFGVVGRVQKLRVKLGDRVLSGEILAEVENQDLKTALEVAAYEVKRHEELSKTKATSRHEFDLARAANDLAQINFEKSLIRAPYDGVIVELNLEVGQLSQITAVVPKALIRIVDVAPRYIRAEMDEVDRPRVKEGMVARVKILAVRREPFRAVVRKIVPWVSSAREQDRTSEFELSIEAEGQLLPAGASADVEVITDEVANTLSLPARAILGRGESRHVFRFLSGKAIKTPVKVGLSNYDRAQILEGIKEGEVALFPAESVDLVDKMKVTLEMQPWP